MIEMKEMLGQYRDAQYEKALAINEAKSALRRAEYHLAIQQEKCDGIKDLLARLEGES